MARNQTDILVKIRVLLEGLGNVRALAGHMKELKAAGGQGGQAVALAGDLDKLSAAVDRLAAAQEKASKSGGFVRFLVGANAAVSVLATIPRAFEGLSKLLDFFDDLGGVAGQAVGKVKEVGSSLFSSLKQAAAGLGTQAAGAIEGLSGAVSGLGAALGAALPFVAAAAAALAALLAVAVPLGIALAGLGAAVAIGLGALLKIGPAGIEANRQLEQVRLGIAAVITSLAELRTGDLSLTGADKFAAAMAAAGDQLAKLRVDAVNTTATFEQIAPAFQAAIAPGLAAKLNLDQIREITVKVVQAAGAIGLPLEQVNQEVRAILEGTINEDARLAKVLGISNKMVASWKAQGKLAEELNKRLEGFATAGEEAANTLDGLTSNLQEALNVFSAEATTRTFDALKDEFRRLLPQLFDFKNSAIAAQFQTLARLADDVLTRVVRLGGAIAQGVVGYLKTAAEFVAQNRAQIDSILNLLELIVHQLLQGAGVLARVATDTGTWRQLLDGVRVMLVLITAALGVLVTELRKAEPLLRLAALAGAAMLAASPALAAASVPNPGPQDEPTGFASVRLNPDGSLKQPTTITAAPWTAGGTKGGGGGGRQSQVRELTRALREAEIGANLAEAQKRFEAVRQDVEASVTAIKNGLDDAIISISEAYRLEAALADKALAAEKERIQAELDAARARRDLAVENLDPKLTAQERRLAIAAEDKKLLAETTRLEGERARLVNETADRKAALVRDEAEANRQLQQTLADVENELDSMSSSAAVRADAAAREIEARFEETRRQLVANFGEASEQVRALDNLIRQLSERAKFRELTGSVETKFGELRDLLELLSVGVESGQIRAQDATRRRLELEREYKRVLRDQIEGLAEIARRTGDPELLAAVRQLQIEWAKLGQVIDATAKRIDDTLRGGLEDALASIITRTETVGEAFRKLAQTILAEIARILAANFVEKLFGGILNTNAQGTSLGGILGRVLGGGQSRPSSNPAPPGAGIENIPLIIRNFQSGTISNLTGIKGNTFGALGELRGGFAGVQTKLNEVITFLPHLLPAGSSLKRDLIVKGIQLAGSIVLKKVSQQDGTGTKYADGGRVLGPGTGTSDSILARLSNGEFVIREWAARRLGLPFLEYLNRMGEAPSLPAFALGGAVGGIADINPPAQVGGDIYHVEVNAPIQTPNPQAFKGSEQLVRRTVARGAQEGLRRARTRPR